MDISNTRAKVLIVLEGLVSGSCLATSRICSRVEDGELANLKKLGISCTTFRFARLQIHYWKYSKALDGDSDGDCCDFIIIYFFSFFNEEWLY